MVAASRIVTLSLGVTMKILPNAGLTTDSK